MTRSASLGFIAEKEVSCFLCLGYGSGSQDSGQYKDTVDLPQTTFGMKANAVQREPEIQKFWEDKQILQKLMEKNTGVGIAFWFWDSLHIPLTLFPLVPFTLSNKDLPVVLPCSDSRFCVWLSDMELRSVDWKYLYILRKSSRFMTDLHMRMVIFTLATLWTRYWKIS